MHNRWYHPPKLHSPKPGHTKKVAWLELFYDLIYVASIIQLGNALSHHVGIGGFLAFAGLFTPLWLAWTSFTFYNNRFTVDDFGHRGLVFLQMFAVGAVAISVPEVMEGRPVAFALSYAAVRLVNGLLYVRALKSAPEARELSKRWAILFISESVIWAVSAALPKPWIYIAWAAAVLIALSIPLAKASREVALRYPPDQVHFTERYGLLVIIVLGESFVKVLSELADKGASLEVYLMGCAAMLITCSLWWIYFDDVAGSRIKAKRAAAFVWVYAHLPITIAVTAVGVAIKKAALFEVTEVAPAKYRWFLCGTLALAYLSVGLVDAVTERRQAELSDTWRVRARFASAVTICLLAIAGGFMPAWAFIVLVLVFCVGQVVWDMMMAPEAMDDHELHHAEHQEVAAGLALGPQPEVVETEEADAPPRTSKQDIGNAIRVGTPNELRRDFYFYVIEGSWARFFLTMGFFYLFINLVFACLYLLEPGCVEGVREGSFLDAFYFSVQTLSTIGYGAMSPITDYGHVIVVVEAAVGMLVVALATGLMFAKASHAKSSVLFSEPMVVTVREGIPTLCFRAGNARGNDVVEASITVSAIIDHVTPEGHTMRRVVGLDLVRSTTPLFTMSWTVMHPLTEDSPLKDCDFRPGGDLYAIVVTLLGHDSTYGQNTHARHIYVPEDVRVGHRFVDVLDQVEDGRMRIDYSKFHDTVPDAVDA